jgi:pentatricopeptide repeat protein
MQQEGVVPNDISFLALLSACSHAGWVSEAFAQLEMMKQFNITPTASHYTCIVDALGRVGRLAEAEQYMYQNITDNIVAYRTLLGACRFYADVECAERVFERAIKLSSTDSAVYVMMFNVYAAAQRWDKVKELRDKMKDNGIKKTRKILV